MLGESSKDTEFKDNVTPIKIRISNESAIVKHDVEI